MQQEWRKNTHRNALTVNERFTFGANGSLSWRKRRKYPRRKFSEAATSQSPTTRFTQAGGSNVDNDAKY
jgi:hypothetical protein